MATPIEDIVGAAVEYKAKTEAGTAKIVEQTRQQSGAAQIIEGLQLQHAENSKVIEAQKQQVALKESAGMKAVAVAADVSVDDQANEVIRLITNQKKLNQTLESTLAKRTSDMQKGFFSDGPIEFVKAQIDLSSSGEVAQAQLAQVQQNHSAIQQTAQAMTAAGQIYASQRELATAATATASIENAATASLVLAQEAKIRGASANISGFQAVMHSSDAELWAMQISQHGFPQLVVP